MKEDWVECTLGEILIIERGGSPRPIKEYITDDLDGINWIKIGDTKGISKYINNTYQKIKPSGLKKTRQVFPGDFLLSNSMSFGRPYIMGIEGAIHDGWLVLRNIYKVVNKDFLFHALSSPFIYNQFSKLAKGSTVKNLNIGLVSKVILKLEPLPVQRAIVSKIDSLFTSLDSGIADLKKAQAQLVIYRQAVLKKAFEGELTAAWRAEQKDLPLVEVLLEEIIVEREKYYEAQLEEWKKKVKEWEENGKEGKKPKKPKILQELPPLTKEQKQKLPKIPIDWKWVKTNDIISNINSGSTPKSNFLSQDEGERPFIKVYNLTFNGTLNFDKNPTFTTNEIHKNKLTRSICYPGDVLINIVGPPLGKVSIVSNLHEEWNINQAIVLFRPNSFVLSKFISYYFQNPVTINWMDGTSKATAGQYNVKVSTCRETPIPFFSVQEQHQIVQEIETRLSVCDKVEETIQVSLKKAESLRQSILKKAFEGKLLTPAEINACKKEADYEPASVLLERIKAEKHENK